MFHHSSCSSIPLDFISVQYTVCVHTQSDIWTPETEISTHKAIYGRQKQKFRTISFRFAPLNCMCDAMTLLLAQPTPIWNRVRKWRHNFRIWISRDLSEPTHSPRSVGRDVNDATSGGRYGWIWLTLFWTFIACRERVFSRNLPSWTRLGQNWSWSTGCDFLSWTCRELVVNES
jgi:hypothetical protein